MQEKKQEKSLVKQNISLYLAKKGVSDYEYYKQSGTTRGILGQNNGISEENIARFLAYAPDVNHEWLLTGHGSMLKTKSTLATRSAHVDDLTAYKDTEISDFQQDFTKEKNNYETILKKTHEEPQVELKRIHQPRSVEKKEDTQVVYLYDFEASAGLRSLFDNNRQNIIDTIKIPNLPKCDGAIHIVGDSMYPLLKSGDIILYKQMPLDMQNLLYGEMYLLSYDIDGDDYIVVKYIRKSDKGEPFITLGSENPEHASHDIDFRRVSALALVKASVRINCMI